MRRPRNGFCPQAAHRPPTLPPRELASAARAAFISITTAEASGLGDARQRSFQESARRKSIGTGRRRSGPLHAPAALLLYRQIVAGQEVGEPLPLGSGVDVRPNEM